MLKKILIGLGIIVVLLAAFVLSYFFYFTRLASPQVELNHSNEFVQVDVFYCQPSKKDRLIFGEESEGALVPFGNYWRLGANQATEIEFNNDVLFNGIELEAGRYRMYAIPHEDVWTIRLNSELDEWGVPEPDYSLDVLETDVPTQQAPEKEKFTISAEDAKNGLDLKLHWDKTMVEVPIRRQ